MNMMIFQLDVLMKVMKNYEEHIVLKENLIKKFFHTEKYCFLPNSSNKIGI
jgi:hypothetical protein